MNLLFQFIFLIKNFIYQNKSYKSSIIDHNHVHKESYRIIVPLKVDITALLTVLSLTLFNQVFAQENKAQDSLMNLYVNLPEGIEKVKTLEELFYSVAYFDPSEAENYARQTYKLAKNLGYASGTGVALYHIAVSKDLQADKDSALYYYNKTLKYASEHDNLMLKANTLAAVALIKNARGNFDEALDHLNETNKIHERLKDYLRYGIGVGNLAALYQDRGNYQIAINYTLDALRILDTIEQEPWRRADLYKQLGGIETMRNNFSESIGYFEKASSIYKDHNDLIYEGFTLSDIGYSYMKLGQLDEAETYLRKAYELGNKNNLNQVKFIALQNLGRINLNRYNYDLARQQISEALQFNLDEKIMLDVTANLFDLGEIAIKTNNLGEGRSLLESGLKLADSLKIPTLKLDFIQSLAKLEAQNNRYPEAYNRMLSFKTLSDSLKKINNNRQIEELKTIYETEEKERELFVKTNELAALQLQQKNDNIRRQFFISLLIAILIISVILSYAYYQKLKRNQEKQKALNENLEFKEKELTTHALHLAHKNEVLLDLKSQLRNAKLQTRDSRPLQNIINNINLDINNDSSWENFRNYFEEVHKDFNSKIIKNYPNVSSNDLRLMALLKMNLSSKEIANILNISNEGVKKARYRLRKKLHLSSEESLQEFVLEQ